MEFFELLRTYAIKNGPSPVKLTTPWRGCGNRYYLVESVLIFDLATWSFVGWLRLTHNSTAHTTIPRTMTTLPEIMKWALAARGWDGLINYTNQTTNLTKEPQQGVPPSTLFPLCNVNREVATKQLDWVYLTERGCWINRDLERCACCVCNPAPTREATECSSVQVAQGHCVYCCCGGCRCPLSGVETSNQCLLAPQKGCICTVCSSRSPV